MPEVYVGGNVGLIVKSRVIATIFYKTDRNGFGERTGAFDRGEFAKLMQDFRRSQESQGAGSMSYSYLIYSVDDPTSYEELRLFFDDIERIERNDR